MQRELIAYHVYVHVIWLPRQYQESETCTCTACNCYLHDVESYPVSRQSTHPGTKEAPPNQQPIQSLHLLP